MKLWILRPIEGNDAWEPWYDKAFGFVVRSCDEANARELAALNHGDEGRLSWLDNTASTCVELLPDGEIEVVMNDFRSA